MGIIIYVVLFDLQFRKMNFGLLISKNFPKYFCLGEKLSVQGAEMEPRWLFYFHFLRIKFFLIGAIQD